MKPVLPHRLECYNARDLDRFLTLLADDVHVSDGETGAIIATSKEQLRPRSAAWLTQMGGLILLSAAETRGDSSEYHA